MNGGMSVMANQINESNFIVRISGRRENCYYIDCQGLYKVTDIAKLTGVESARIKEKFTDNGAVYDASMDVYYFDGMDKAKKAIADILKEIKTEWRGRVLFLTESEIEYIRKALINEQSNTIHVKNSIKDAIFKKLNA
jgi:hypothetical protein